MPNETETPSMQSERSSTGSAEEATGDSSQSYPGSRHGNGFDSTASQYRAMQEAQLLHEETINQLREEVRGQRERLAELARGTPVQRGGQLDVVMLRLSELERKIGEGAPDPLINEIVHRLAALENAGPMRGAKDPRVDDLTAQLEGLRQLVNEADNRDSRTDDVVLRIASLEGAFRRAAQSRDPEEVQARIDALSEAMNSRQEAQLAELRGEFRALSQTAAEAASKVTDAASASALDSLSGRLAGLERRLSESRTEERLTEFGSQLAALDRKLAEQNAAGIDSRVQALEQRASQDNTDEVLQLIAERISAVEQKVEENPAAGALAQVQQLEARVMRVEESPDLDSLRERLASVASQLEGSEAPQKLLELAERLSALEARAGAAPADDLYARLAELTNALSSKVSTEELGRLESRLGALKSESAPAIVPPDVALRLDALTEAVGSKVSSDELALLESRLSALKADTASAALSPDVALRLDALSEAVASKASTTDITRLESRLSAIQLEAAQPGAAALPADLSARLTELESRLSEAESSSRLEDADARLGAVESKMGALGDPAEISRRLTVLEMDSSPADPHLEDVLQRLAALENKPFESLSDSRLHELSQSVVDLQNELDRVSTDRLPLLNELPNRLASLEERVLEAAKQKGSASTPAGSLDELHDRIAAVTRRVEELAARPFGVQDARVSELIARVEWVERNQSVQSDGADLDAFKRRLEAVEQSQSSGPESSSLSRGMQTELTMRLSALEQEIRRLEDNAGAFSGGADFDAALKKESDRWTQWARSTMEELGDLRDRVEAGGSSSGASGVDAESFEALAVQISSGLNNSEVKALRNQMYFVYLTIGVLWAILIFVLFVK